ncbi:hypothetical protein VitviT2T_027177 [Vitis vinifera]|uniref:FLZ-type domain-containing protein n=3 Tax=Vitis TaxID=3603 RepID=A0A438F8I2_VITVI|nr:FCS-Like Zinc finger 5 [Vitis vinifera]RVW56258.1 hypothetical protein CK203_096973 [Vitis vinifera]RVW65354.1 hypothetical protein CK203_022065 [Vitis vinifera]WKA09543.1 hypothetical protein VitviT2T_027177 [Vitis vinifera]|eukprot:XP_002285807.2 PREDICTED: uncharacterized protein LOC100252409 [Vitis vinifera]
MNGPDWLLAFWPCVYLPLSTPSPLLLSHSVLSLDFEVVKRRGVRGAAAEEKMLLGKRPRPPMKRTTSMTEFTLDPNSVQQPPSDSQNPFKDRPKSVGFGGDPYRQPSGVDGYGFDHRFLSAVSPRNPRRYSADFVDNSHFLRACCLCKRRLVSGRDIYMYRGDSAFCSLECRQQQMNQDERKEKCSLASKKEATASTAGSEGETVAAI